MSRTLEALSLDRGASHGEYQAHVDAPGGRWARAALGRMRGGWVLGGRDDSKEAIVKAAAEPKGTRAQRQGRPREEP